MAIPEYVPTDWVDDSVPAINASKLNKIETGIKEVTDEVIDIKDNPIKATETILGVAKIWITVVDGVTIGHIDSR